MQRLIGALGALMLSTATFADTTIYFVNSGVGEGESRIEISDGAKDVSSAQRKAHCVGLTTAIVPPAGARLRGDAIFLQHRNFRIDTDDFGT